MDIKVICQCQAKFQFEVEPVDGRMPGPIQCPVCGVDATEAANALIAQKLAQPAAPAPVTPAASQAPSPSTARRVGLASVHQAAAAPAPAPEPSPAVEGLQYCPRHGSELSVAECFVCQKPICGTCMQQFGFLCSTYCKNQAIARNLKVPKFEGQLQEQRETERRGINRFIGVAAVAVGLFLAGVLWYWFVGSKPKTAFKIETGAGTPFLHADWVGSDRFFTVTPARITLFNGSNGEEVWSTELPANEIKGFKSRDDEWYFPFRPVVKKVSNDIWVGLPGRVLRFDAATGKRKQELPLGRRADDFLLGDTHLLAVSHNPTNDSKTLTRVNLASGQVDVQQTPDTSGATRVVGITQTIPGLRNTSLSKMPLDDEDFSSTYFPSDPDYSLAGATVVHMSRELVEERIAVQASTKPKAKTALDNPKLRASQSLEVAEEFLNQNRQETRIDQSLYSVTLTRYFGGGAAWKGQVTGRPYFFGLKSVDLLVAGTNLTVFNKNNQKIWEARLAYGVSPGFHDSERVPAVEVGGRLLFFDQGVLTCFDSKTGKADWRVNSVGIESVVSDGHGSLFLGSTTAGPESIKYNQQISLSDRIRPLILKVDLKSGKVLWQTPMVGSDCKLSGDHLYTTQSQVSWVDRMNSAVNGTDTVPVNFRLYHIDTSSGRQQWEYHCVGVPQGILPNEKRILVQSPTVVRMLKFL